MTSSSSSIGRQVRIVGITQRAMHEIMALNEIPHDARFLGFAEGEFEGTFNAFFEHRSFANITTDWVLPPSKLSRSIHGKK